MSLMDDLIDRPLLVVIIIVIVVCSVLGYLGCYTDVLKEKVYIACGTIVSVNGITDIDTGLFSSGSTTSSSIMFKDGRVIFFVNRIRYIQLNKYCEVRYKKTRFGNRFKSIKCSDKAVFK